MSELPLRRILAEIAVVQNPARRMAPDYALQPGDAFLRHAADIPCLIGGIDGIHLAAPASVFQGPRPGDHYRRLALGAEKRRRGGNWDGTAEKPDPYPAVFRH